jgi:methionyl-tRNA formyltransferase
LRIILFADGIVGYRITEFLLQKYQKDTFIVITTSRNEISALAEKFLVSTFSIDISSSQVTEIHEKVDLGILAWWPRIINSDLIEISKNGFINLHPSLLPNNRGKHPNFWAIVEENPFGVSIHKVDEGIDSGPIIAQEKIEYDWSDTGETLYRKAQRVIVDLFQKTYPEIVSGKYRLQNQELNTGTFHMASEIELASEIKLDRQYWAKDLLNLLRARSFAGKPACWFADGESKYEVTIKIIKIST